jgi:hypothetical protein
MFNNWVCLILWCIWFSNFWVTFLISSTIVTRLPSNFWWLGPINCVEAVTRSSLRAEINLADTDSVIIFAGTPAFIASITAHLPVPFWAAASRILSTRWSPKSKFFRCTCFVHSKHHMHSMPPTKLILESENFCRIF